MRFDRAGIESVDLRDLGPAAGAAQLGRKGLERRGIAPCQEEFRTLSREYLSNRAADVAARTVLDPPDRLDRAMGIGGRHGHRSHHHRSRVTNPSRHVGCAAG